MKTTTNKKEKKKIEISEIPIDEEIKDLLEDGLIYYMIKWDKKKKK